MTMLVFVEHESGMIAPGSTEALSLAARAGTATGSDVTALAIGPGAEVAVGDAGRYGASVLLAARHQLLDGYGPGPWGETLAQAVEATAATMVLASGSDRGNEVVAHAAARLDAPMAANCVEVDPDGGEVTRVRWGGSLLERAGLDGPPRFVTVAEHAVEPVETPVQARVEELAPDLDPSLAATIVADRVVLTEGTTLATAPVVVGGGRGVGSAEGFATLERLAGMLGGVVGCSRVVTNNGWRPHADQVGQTGTRIAPQLYIACGISGAIQHWVGAMASKQILAINTDREANMVTRADYAVVGDLHAIMPAVIEEIERRRAARPG